MLHDIYTRRIELHHQWCFAVDLEEELSPLVEGKDTISVSLEKGRKRCDIAACVFIYPSCLGCTRRHTSNCGFYSDR